MGGGVKNRLLEYLYYKRISQKKFCISIGASPAYVLNIVNGIGMKKLRKIMEVYPDLNIEWLHTGAGKMIKCEDNESDKPSATPADCSVGVDGNIIKVISGMQDQINIWIKERDYWKDECLSKDEQIQELKAELKEWEDLHGGRNVKGLTSMLGFVHHNNVQVDEEIFIACLKAAIHSRKISDALLNRSKINAEETGLSEEEEKQIFFNALVFAQDFVEKGDVKFKDFFATMVSLLGDNIRPYIKEIYLGISARVSDEVADKMDDRKTVRAFDINSNIEDDSDAEAETETK